MLLRSVAVSGAGEAVCMLSVAETVPVAETLCAARCCASISDV